MNKKRSLIFYKNHFSEFFDKLPIKVQDKIDQVLYMVMVLERIPIKFFRHMKGTDGLYEIEPYENATHWDDYSCEIPCDL